MVRRAHASLLAGGVAAGLAIVACVGTRVEGGGEGVDGGADARREGGPTLPDPDRGEDAEAPVDASADGSTLSDGGADADAAEAGPSARKRVFVTRTRYDGNLRAAGSAVDGLTGADNLCTRAATSANLGGKWRAWLSTSTVDAISRIVDVGPWYLVDGTTLVFADKAQLATTPTNAIRLNESGSSLIVGTVQRTWTGTLVGGRKTNALCGDWGSTAGAGGVGVFTEKDADWTRYGLDSTESCTATAAIYCFEQ